VLELHVGNHGLETHLRTGSSQEELDPHAKRRGDRWGRKDLSWEELDSRVERRGDRWGEERLELGGT
jgi:hypothetical protein